MTKQEIIKNINRLERKIDDIEECKHDICSDPMNMCPGDFAEDFDRQIEKVDIEIMKLQGMLEK